MCSSSFLASTTSLTASTARRSTPTSPLFWATLPVAGSQSGTWSPNITYRQNSMMRRTILLSLLGQATWSQNEQCRVRIQIIITWSRIMSNTFAKIAQCFVVAPSHYSRSHSRSQLEAALHLTRRRVHYWGSRRKGRHSPEIGHRVQEQRGEDPHKVPRLHTAQNDFHPQSEAGGANGTDAECQKSTVWTTQVKSVG